METIKKRGGKRPGAGRRYLHPWEEPERAISKTITLTWEEWEALAHHAPGLSPSKAIKLALDMACTRRPNGEVAAGWRV